MPSYLGTKTQRARCPACKGNLDLPTTQLKEYIIEKSLQSCREKCGSCDVFVTLTPKNDGKIEVSA